MKKNCTLHVDSCSLCADGGYYLFPDCHEVIPVKLLTLNATDQQDDDDITVSLLNWW